MKRLLQGITGVICLAYCAMAHAQTPVDFYQSWSTPGLKGWTNQDALLSLSNPGGYLNVAFPAQAQPLSQASIAYTNLISGVLPTNISLAIKPFQFEPSVVRVYVHSSASNRTWYCALDRLSTNVWTSVDIPVVYGENWISDPGLGQAAFQSDMLSANWIGVYFRRNGTAEAQNYGIDDFLIQGLVQPSGLSISGVVLYEGEQTGTIFVSATSPNVSGEVAVATPGSYAITNLPLSQSYTVAGYRDSNGNHTQEFWEATGVWNGNPANLYLDDLTDANIAMADPTSADGLPYWWLNLHLGVTEPGGGGGSGATQGQQDADTDRFSNFAEYWAGTDPTNPLSFFAVDIAYTNNAGSSSVMLSWGAIPNRTYGIWRSTSVGGGFTKIQGGLSTNSFDDVTATGRGPYFYRVEVEVP